LLRAGVVLLLVHAPASLQADLKRHRVEEVIGADHIFDSLHEALTAIHEQRVRGVEAGKGGAGMKD
jgi:hypothetical protein